MRTGSGGLRNPWISEAWTSVLADLETREYPRLEPQSWPTEKPVNIRGLNLSPGRLRTPWISKAWTSVLADCGLPYNWARLLWGQDGRRSQTCLHGIDLLVIHVWSKCTIGKHLWHQWIKKVSGGSEQSTGPPNLVSTTCHWASASLENTVPSCTLVKKWNFLKKKYLSWMIFLIKFWN